MSPLPPDYSGVDGSVAWRQMAERDLRGGSRAGLAKRLRDNGSHISENAVRKIELREHHVSGSDLVTLSVVLDKTCERLATDPTVRVLEHLAEIFESLPLTIPIVPKRCRCRRSSKTLSRRLQSSNVNCWTERSRSFHA